MATTITRRLIVIDDDVSVDELLGSWKNGNHKDVIEKLKADHPGLTAFFLSEGIRWRTLEQGDVDSIVNQLIDDRVYLVNHPA